MRWPNEVRVYVEWRDCWLGAYIDPTPERLRLYVCLLPCLPIRLTWVQP